MNHIRGNFKAAILKAEQVNESDLPVTIGNEIAGYVDKNDQATIDDIKRLSGASSFRNNLISHFEELGMANKDATTVFNIITKGSDMKLVSEYLMNNKRDIQTFLDKKIDVYGWLASIGITDKNTANAIYDYATNTKPSTGPAEIFLSLFVDGGRRPGKGEKGDVRINGLEVEVKSMNGRLMGQKGYGDAKTMRSKFKSILEEIADNFKVDIKVDDSNDKNFNITKKDTREVGRVLNEIVNQRGKFSKKDTVYISGKILEAYNVYLIGAKDIISKYIAPISTTIKSSGAIDTKAFHNLMLSLYFDYYHSLEDFEFIALANPNKGLLLITNPTKFKNYIKTGEIDYTPPSFSDAAGSQGGTYAITLK